MSYSKRKRIDVYSDINGKINDYDILKNVPTIDGVPVHGDITESGRYTDETPTAGSKRLITSGAVKAAMERGNVQSVNGKTGEVELSAADVHALPDTTIIPVVPKNISAFNNDADYVSSEELSGKSDIGHAHDDIYYTEAEIDSLLDGKSDSSHTHDERYYTEDEADALLSDKSDIGHNHDDLYYTETEVDSLISQAQDDAYNVVQGLVNALEAQTEMKLSAKSDTGHTHEEYAKQEEIPTVPENVSAFNNDAGYLTEHQSLENYPTKSEVETDFIEARAEIVEALGKKQDVIEKYVESINGYSGAVNLSASDVKALPDTTVIPTVPNNVSEFVNDAGYLTEHQSLAEYEKKSETDEKIATHNVGDTSHQDIRLLIANLVNRLNAIADSDDITLDQLSEIVAYIKSNKSLIDAITTEKISYSDIINNLETNVANKPLSASMGVVLKATIDAIVIPTKVSAFENDKSYVTSTELATGLSGKQDKLSSYVSSVNGKSGTVNLTASDVEALPATTEIPTVPTKVSAFENDKGYLTEHQSLDGYAKTSDVEALKQPFVVTCVADMQNMVYTNVSHTFEEIKEAYLRGDHIFVIADIGQMHSGRYSIAPLTSYGDNYMLFEYVSISGKKSYLVTGFLHSDNSNSFRMTELVSQTQLNGLTFNTSSSVPTVDDRSVITFVIEG